MASTAAAAAAGSGQPAPGIRAAKLTAVFAKALATCVASGKGIDLGEVFPTLYPEHKDTIDELFGNLLDMVQEASSDEFEKICAEKHVVEKLNALDGLHAQAAELKAVGVSIRPQTDDTSVKKMVSASSAKSAASEVQALKAVLADLNSRNADLESSIDTLSREADSIVAEVDGAVGKMDEVTTAAEEATKTLQDSG
ncbi:unnamed protein product [Symbiodinium sp. KB8]|nr:unnamed protein product [Symbiodinium sp. KB8]